MSRGRQKIGTNPAWASGLLLPLLAVLFVCAWFGCLTPAAVAQEEERGHRPDLEAGRSQYLANCARCHGVEGGGGEGPPLARVVLPRAPTDTALVRLIAAGIDGTAMGPTWWLSREDRENVAGFVRSLATSEAEDGAGLAGDPERGEDVFREAGCEGCHTVHGFGTARGPDLSTVGGRRGVTYLRRAIVDPAAALPRGMTAMPTDFVDYLVVRVVDAEGGVLRGMRMNEDTYTIQIKDARGVIHSYDKRDLTSLEREFDRSLMQSYEDRLTEDELDDLIAYLASLSGGPRGIS
ncbi:MAG: c-type cytochrome [Longimicrobiales bacterium]|nr:c-type cytochrome [Longimicrobiales bacterium]